MELAHAWDLLQTLDWDSQKSLMGAPLLEAVLDIMRELDVFFRMIKVHEMLQWGSVFVIACEVN